MTDLSHLRADFPILGRQVNGQRLVYLDSAASSQKPVAVLEAMDEFYRTSYANVHRGAYALSGEATDAYEHARATVARFINAASPREVLFTRGTTTSINGIATGWGAGRLQPGDRILLTVMEHHSNVVPWQLLAARTGAELVYAPLTDRYELDLEALAALLDERVAIVSLTGMSNVLGTMPPIRQVADLAHQAGAVVVVDAAQLVPHAPVDVQSLGCDFLAFSGHKMLGPTGIGVLWGRLPLLEEMDPYEGGGEMISEVRLHESTWAPVPQKFEAGTPPIVEAVGLAAAIRYLEKVGMAEVRRHDVALTRYALDRLQEVPQVTVYGSDNVERRGGTVSLTMADIHPHDLATILDDQGVAVRAGHHCARPLMDALGIPATARASFYLYNTTEEVDALIEGLHRAGELFGVA